MAFQSEADAVNKNQTEQMFNSAFGAGGRDGDGGGGGTKCHNISASVIIFHVPHGT